MQQDENNAQNQNMDKIQILVIGRDPVVLQKLLRFINENPNWEGTGTVDDKTAHYLFEQTKYPYVVLVDQLSEPSLESFQLEFEKLNPEVVLIRHYGDSTGLLASEVYDLLKNHPVKMENTEGG